MTAPRQFHQAEITHTANVLRKTFVRLKTSVLRKPYKPSPRVSNPAVYENMALNCLTCEANPEIFVEAAFEFCKEKAGPLPTQLTGQAGRNWFERKKASGTADTRNIEGGMFPIDDGTKGVEETLKGMVEGVLKHCLEVTGEPLGSKAFMETLLLFSTPGPITVKLLLAFPYPEWREAFFEQYEEAATDAQKCLIENPSFVAAADAHGLPATEVIIYEAKKAQSS